MGKSPPISNTELFEVCLRVINVLRLLNAQDQYVVIAFLIYNLNLSTKEIEYSLVDLKEKEMQRQGRN